MIGDTYLAMKDKGKAKEWYEKTIAMPEGGSVAEREAQVRDQSVNCDHSNSRCHLTCLSFSTRRSDCSSAVALGKIIMWSVRHTIAG